MRTATLLAAAVLLPLLEAASSTIPAVMPISVVLKLDSQNHSEAALRTMKSEVEAALNGSGLQFDWRTPASFAERTDYGELVVFTMKGKCAMDLLPYVADEMGQPLATTHTSDGEVLSFGQVDCDRIRNLLRRSLSPGDYGRGDVLLGRALGRVVAHELYHMLSRSGSHDHQGISRKCLSPRELTAERLTMSEKSLKAIREQMRLVRIQNDSSRQARPEEAVSLP